MERNALLLYLKNIRDLEFAQIKIQQRINVIYTHNNSNPIPSNIRKGPLVCLEGFSGKVA